MDIFDKMDREASNPRNIAIGQDIAEQLQILESHFKPGMKLTFFVRDPEDDDCTMIVSNDDDVRDAAQVLMRAAWLEWHRRNSPRSSASSAVSRKGPSQ